MSIDLSELEALQQQVVDARNQMREKAKQLVSDGTKVIFEEYGDIVESFGWTQYTPYFNDGDECVFGVGELKIMAAEAEDDDREDYRYGETTRAFSSYSEASRIKPSYGEPGENYDQRYQDAYEAIHAIYNVFSIDQSIAKDIFGDHVEVVFGPDGVEVEDYSHE